jgi:hypothetical protein
MSTPKPPVDLNKPVENPELSLAMMAFSRSRNAQTEQELTLRLRSAVFLVPIITDEMRTTPGSEPGSATIEQGSLIKMLSCIDGTGAQHLPLFTDWPSIRAWTEQQVSTLVMPAADAWGFVLSQAHYAGAVVNPGERALPLSRPLIQYLKDGYQGA